MFLKLSLNAHVTGFLKTSNPLFEMDNFNSCMSCVNFFKIFMCQMTLTSNQPKFWYA